MTALAQNPAESSQAPARNGCQSIFNLVKRTPEGKRVICHDLTFAQAAALVPELTGAVIQFSRFEVTA
jgi:hypothetical protein